MCLDSFLSARSMHDVAWYCAMNYVRNRDAQKQLARTSLSDLTKQQAARIKKRTLFMSSLMSNPSTTAVPDVMVSSPVNMRNVVVFPAPLIPRRPKHSLMGTPRHRLSTAINGKRPREKNVAYLLFIFINLVSSYLINYIHDLRDHLRWFPNKPYPTIK